MYIHTNTHMRTLSSNKHTQKLKYRTKKFAQQKVVVGRRRKKIEKSAANFCLDAYKRNATYTRIYIHTYIHMHIQLRVYTYNMCIHVDV